jgi:hypothetical protein
MSTRQRRLERVEARLRLMEAQREDPSVLAVAKALADVILEAEHRERARIAAAFKSTGIVTPWEATKSHRLSEAIRTGADQVVLWSLIIEDEAPEVVDGWHRELESAGEATVTAR